MFKNIPSVPHASTGKEDTTVSELKPKRLRVKLKISANKLWVKILLACLLMAPAYSAGPAVNGANCCTRLRKWYPTMLLVAVGLYFTIYIAMGIYFHSVPWYQHPHYMSGTDNHVITKSWFDRVYEPLEITTFAGMGIIGGLTLLGMTLLCFKNLPNKNTHWMAFGIGVIALGLIFAQFFAFDHFSVITQWHNHHFGHEGGRLTSDYMKMVDPVGLFDGLAYGGIAAGVAGEIARRYIKPKNPKGEEKQQLDETGSSTGSGVDSDPQDPQNSRDDGSTSSSEPSEADSTATSTSSTNDDSSTSDTSFNRLFSGNNDDESSMESISSTRSDTSSGDRRDPSDSISSTDPEADPENKLPEAKTKEKAPQPTTSESPRPQPKKKKCKKPKKKKRKKRKSARCQGTNQNIFPPDDEDRNPPPPPIAAVSAVERGKITWVAVDPKKILPPVVCDKARVVPSRVMERLHAATAAPA